MMRRTRTEMIAMKIQTRGVTWKEGTNDIWIENKKSTHVIKSMANTKEQTKTERNTFYGLLKVPFLGWKDETIQRQSLRECKEGLDVYFGHRAGVPLIRFANLNARLWQSFAQVCATFRRWHHIKTGKKNNKQRHTNTQHAYVYCQLEQFHASFFLNGLTLWAINAHTQPCSPDP